MRGKEAFVNYRSPGVWLEQSIHWEGTEESKTPAAGGLHPDQVPGACAARHREPGCARRRLPARAA